MNLPHDRLCLTPDTASGDQCASCLRIALIRADEQEQVRAAILGDLRDHVDGLRRDSGPPLGWMYSAACHDVLAVIYEMADS